MKENTDAIVASNKRCCLCSQLTYLILGTRTICPSCYIGSVSTWPGDDKPEEINNYQSNQLELDFTSKGATK